MSNVYKVRRLDDLALYNLFMRGKEAASAVSAANKLRGPKIKIRLSIQGLPTMGRLNPDTIKPKAGKYTITSAELSFHVDATNGIEVAKSFKIMRSPEGQYDTLHLPIFPQNQNDRPYWNTEECHAVLFAAYETLTDALMPASDDARTEIGQLTNFATNIDSSFRSFTQELASALAMIAEQRAADRESNEEERKRIVESAQNEIDEKISRLDKREKDLVAREESLQIKSHKDARRQLFNTLQKDLQDRTKAPSATLSVNLTRWAIFLTLCIGGGLAAWFAAIAMSPDALPESASTFQIWTVILKPIGLSVLALGSFAAAVQWLRHFYTQDLRDAVEAQRFGHDMARASWIMEAYLEMTKEHGLTEVPESWMRNATEGMFQGDRSKHGVDEASQALAALLGISASVKAGPNGLEATVGKRGLRKLSEASQGDDG